jgi:hypothetical protein
MLRCPVSLSRIHWTPGSKTLFYQSKQSHDDPLFSHPKGETLDVLEFVARVLTQIPALRRNGVHYYGVYSSRARHFRKKRGLSLGAPAGHSNQDGSPDEPTLSSKQRAALRKSWAKLLWRVYEVDPLTCSCGGRLRVVSFITEPKLVRKILAHLRKTNSSSRNLLRNETTHRNHWVVLRLVGRPSNRDGFGALVRVKAGSAVQIDELRSGTSYLSQNDPRLHFGLGRSASADAIEIRWPSGLTQTLRDFAADRIFLVREGDAPETTR